MRDRIISWATRHMHACTIIYVIRMSAFSTKSMNFIIEFLQSSVMTKLNVIDQRSYQDFYSVDLEGTRT
jgi:hypothetical protein